MLEVQKIFYFHVSSAFTVFLAFGVTALFSLLYLIKRKEQFDTVAAASAELGIVFCTIVLLTGPDLGEARLEYVVELGTQTDKHAHSLADVYRLLYSEIGADGGRRNGFIRRYWGFSPTWMSPIVYFSVEIWQGQPPPRYEYKDESAPDDDSHLDLDVGGVNGGLCIRAYTALRHGTTEIPLGNGSVPTDGGMTRAQVKRSTKPL